MRSRSFKEHFKLVAAVYIDLALEKFEASRKAEADKHTDFRFTLNGVTKDFTREEIMEKLGFEENPNQTTLV